MIRKIALLAPGQYDPDLVSDETGLACSAADDRCQQQFKSDCDINQLVRRFGITGQVPMAKQPAEYGDFSEVTDFQSAMNQLRQGQEAFDALPGAIRRRFNNNPAALWSFLQDEGNYDEAVKLGILAKPARIAQDRDGEATPSGEAA